jgi:Mg2+ and Co2+ transporter CorA
MVGNRQSLDEAASVRVLTLLGMTFLPLSLVSSLFSMGGAFLPGERLFWVYWAAALPFVLVVYSVAWAVVKIIRLERRDEADKTG